MQIGLSAQPPPKPQNESRGGHLPKLRSRGTMTETHSGIAASLAPEGYSGADLSTPSRSTTGHRSRSGSITKDSSPAFFGEREPSEELSSTHTSVPSTSSTSTNNTSSPSIMSMGSIPLPPGVVPLAVPPPPALSVTSDNGGGDTSTWSYASPIKSRQHRMKPLPLQPSSYGSSITSIPSGFRSKLQHHLHQADDFDGQAEPQTIGVNTYVVVAAESSPSRAISPPGPIRRRSRSMAGNMYSGGQQHTPRGGGRYPPEIVSTPTAAQYANTNKPSLARIPIPVEGASGVFLHLSDAESEVDVKSGDDNNNKKSGWVDNTSTGSREGDTTSSARHRRRVRSYEDSIHVYEDSNNNNNIHARSNSRSAESPEHVSKLAETPVVHRHHRGVAGGSIYFGARPIGGGSNTNARTQRTRRRDGNETQIMSSDSDVEETSGSIEDERPTIVRKSSSGNSHSPSPWGSGATNSNTPNTSNYAYAYGNNGGVNSGGFSGNFPDASTPKMNTSNNRASGKGWKTPAGTPVSGNPFGESLGTNSTATRNDSILRNILTQGGGGAPGKPEFSLWKNKKLGGGASSQGPGLKFGASTSTSATDSSAFGPTSDNVPPAPTVVEPKIEPKVEPTPSRSASINNNGSAVSSQPASKLPNPFATSSSTSSSTPVNPYTTSSGSHLSNSNMNSGNVYSISNAHVNSMNNRAGAPGVVPQWSGSDEETAPSREKESRRPTFSRQRNSGDSVNMNIIDDKLENRLENRIDSRLENRIDSRMQIPNTNNVNSNNTSTNIPIPSIPSSPSQGKYRGAATWHKHRQQRQQINNSFSTNNTTSANLTNSLGQGSSAEPRNAVPPAHRSPPPPPPADHTTCPNMNILPTNVQTHTHTGVNNSTLPSTVSTNTYSQTSSEHPAGAPTTHETSTATVVDESHENIQKQNIANNMNNNTNVGINNNNNTGERRRRKPPPLEVLERSPPRPPDHAGSGLQMQNNVTPVSNSNFNMKSNSSSMHNMSRHAYVVGNGGVNCVPEGEGSTAHDGGSKQSHGHRRRHTRAGGESIGAQVPHTNTRRRRRSSSSNKHHSIPATPTSNNFDDLKFEEVINENRLNLYHDSDSLSPGDQSFDEETQWACNNTHARKADFGDGIRWKRGEQIGEGSFGKVYMGFNERTGELFAVKQISLMDGTQEEAEQLEAEINLMKRLRHRHIVRYVGTGRGERHLYIFLEYVSGGSIASMLAQFGVFHEDLLKRFVYQILLGVSYLHAYRIIHRDIKGANVLVTDQGIAKLADFGCSKQLQGMRTQSFDESLSHVKGSVPWMAPEVIKQTGHGRSADIWSIGSTIIEMSTARRPWPAFSNNLATMFHVATAKHPPPLPEGISHQGRDFLSHCLCIDPNERWKAAALLEHPFLFGAAEELLATTGLGAVSVSSESSSGTPSEGEAEIDFTCKSPQRTTNTVHA